MDSEIVPPSRKMKKESHVWTEVEYARFLEFWNKGMQSCGDTKVPELAEELGLDTQTVKVNQLWVTENLLHHTYFLYQGG